MIGFLPALRRDCSLWNILSLGLLLLALHFLQCLDAVADVLAKLLRLLLDLGEARVVLHELQVREQVLIHRDHRRGDLDEVGLTVINLDDILLQFAKVDRSMDDVHLARQNLDELALDKLVVLQHRRFGFHRRTLCLGGRSVAVGKLDAANGAGQVAQGKLASLRVVVGGQTINLLHDAEAGSCRAVADGTDSAGTGNVDGHESLGRDTSVEAALTELGDHLASGVLRVVVLTADTAEHFFQQRFPRLVEQGEGRDGDGGERIHLRLQLKLGALLGRVEDGLGCVVACGLLEERGQVLQTRKDSLAVVRRVVLDDLEASGLDEPRPDDGGGEVLDSLLALRFDGGQGGEQQGVEETAAQTIERGDDAEDVGTKPTDGVEVAVGSDAVAEGLVSLRGILIQAALLEDELVGLPVDWLLGEDVHGDGGVQLLHPHIDQAALCLAGTCAKGKIVVLELALKRLPRLIGVTLLVLRSRHDDFLGGGHIPAKLPGKLLVLNLLEELVGRNASRDAGNLKLVVRGNGVAGDEEVANGRRLETPVDVVVKERPSNARDEALLDKILVAGGKLLPVLDHAGELVGDNRLPIITLLHVTKVDRRGDEDFGGVNQVDVWSGGLLDQLLRLTPVDVANLP